MHSLSNRKKKLLQMERWRKWLLRSFYAKFARRLLKRRVS
jgi:hypothetical protein